MTTTETVILAAYLLIGVSIITRASAYERSLLRKEIRHYNDIATSFLLIAGFVCFWPLYLIEAYFNWRAGK